MRQLPILILLILFFSPTTLWSKTIELLEIERSRDIEKVVYVLNINDENHIDSKKPIIINWRNNKKGTSRSLSYIQNKFAYGIKIIEQTGTECSFNIAAVPNQVFTVKGKKDVGYELHTNIDKKNAIVKSIYIAFKKGTIWVPEIDSIQMRYTDCISNKEKIKTIISK